MAKPLTNRRGDEVFRITEDDYEDAENGGGICLSCGEREGGCEPDARNYKCSNCGLMELFGLEEALVMGRIEFADEENPRERGDDDGVEYGDPRDAKEEF